MDDRKQYKWLFDNYKVVKIIKSSEKVSFQRKGNTYNRGITISKDAFYKIDDVNLNLNVNLNQIIH